MISGTSCQRIPTATNSEIVMIIEFRLTEAAVPDRTYRMTQYAMDAVVVTKLATDR